MPTFRNRLMQKIFITPIGARIQTFPPKSAKNFSYSVYDPLKEAGGY